MALKSLAARVNRSTGISHPSDKKATIDTFRILYENNESYDTDEIKSWLILKADWEPNFAEDLTVIARGISEGKSFRSADMMPSFNPDAISKWREDSENSSKNSEDWKNLF